MPHAILHGMGMFAASNTYVRIREHDNNYLSMNQGRRGGRRARAGQREGALRFHPSQARHSCLAVRARGVRVGGPGCAPAAGAGESDGQRGRRRGE